MAYESTLGDGRRIAFRKLRPEDKDLIRDGFERLSPESRYRRFFRNMDRLTDEQLRYLTEVDFKHHFAWVAVLPGEIEHPGAGVGRWIRLSHEPRIAEGAVTVVDELQGLGIGTTLLWLTARSAIENGIEAVRVYVQGDNQPALRLLRELGIRPGLWEGGITQIDVPLPSDPDDLAATPPLLMLRAVATGEIEAVDTPTGGTRFVSRAPDRI
jgi:GNAT superfamily N-acetyltransferase